MNEMKLKILLFTSFAILLVTIIIVPMANAEYDNGTPITTSFITIDPIGNHTIGDVFFINGTTNLAVTQNLTIHVYPLASTHEPRGRIPPPGIFVDGIPIVPVTNGVNRWSVNVTNGYWRSEEFIVIIWATKFIPEVPIYFNSLTVYSNDPLRKFPYPDKPGCPIPSDTIGYCDYCRGSIFELVK
jgi:hypothetical protein